MKKDNRDRHHVLFGKRFWSLKPYSCFRENPSMIITLHEEAHYCLHEECSPVPVLGYPEITRIKDLWVPGHDTLDSIKNLCDAISVSMQHFKPVDRQVAVAMINALKSQVPYIRQGLRKRKP